MQNKNSVHIKTRKVFPSMKNKWKNFTCLWVSRCYTTIMWVFWMKVNSVFQKSGTISLKIFKCPKLWIKKYSISSYCGYYETDNIDREEIKNNEINLLPVWIEEIYKGIKLSFDENYFQLLIRILNSQNIILTAIFHAIFHESSCGV